MEALQDDSEVLYNSNEEKSKLYISVVQNIKKVIESTSKLEVDAEKLIESLKSKLEAKQKREHELFNAFRKLRHSVIAKAKLSKKGHGLDQSTINEFEEEEDRKRKEIDIMRLTLIKTKTQVQKIEKKLKTKEKLDQELDSIGFEQLQSENVSFQKRLENRQKEIDRYRSKLDENCQKISTLTKTIGDAEVARHEEQIRALDQDISRVSKELSLLNTQYKELQKDSKMQSAALSGRVVQEHYLSSMDDIQLLIQNLDSLKARYCELTKNNIK